jgi:putative transposase
VGTIAIDFLTVPTVTFDIVYVFFVLSLERRCALHLNVTAHPYAAWTAQQIVEAIGAEIVPAPLVRDRDAYLRQRIRRPCGQPRRAPVTDRAALRGSRTSSAS